MNVALGWGSRMVEQTQRETTGSSPSHFHPLLPWEVVLYASSERRHWDGAAGSKGVCHVSNTLLLPMVRTEGEVM